VEVRDFGGVKVNGQRGAIGYVANANPDPNKSEVKK